MFVTPGTWRDLRWKATSIAAGFLILLTLFGRHEWKHIEINPDSAGYQRFATNIVQGQSYDAAPHGRLDLYRTPGYPVFLAAVYRIHGINPDAVLRYQLLLTGLTGAMMVMIGWLLWGTLGGWTGLAAVVVLGMNRDAAYATSQLLSECLATFLLTAGATAAAWAQRGSWRREVLVGLLLSLAILTRPGLLFVGLAYGVILLLTLRMATWKRAAAYAAACVLLLLPWTIYASLESGRFVALASNTSTVMVAGIDPLTSAKLAGLAAPALEQESLHRYWNDFPGYTPRSGDLKAAVKGIPGRWREVLALTKIKLKVATKYLPATLWASMLLGLALAGGIRWWVRDAEDVDGHFQLRVEVLGPVKSSRWPRRLLQLGLALLIGMALGWSSPLGEGFFWALPLLLPLFGMVIGPAATPSGSSDQRASSSWLLSWYVGFVTMTLLSFGLPRFMRPFLPVFYLCAVAAIPMLAGSLLALCQGRVRLGERGLLEFVVADAGAHPAQSQLR